ncbi:MAG: hypothetical protein NXI00_12240 [Cytophagales bacterium]|nr:hypothetical protein [Cytophagales bacterium]
MLIYKQILILFFLFLNVTLFSQSRIELERVYSAELSQEEFYKAGSFWLFNSFGHVDQSPQKDFIFAKVSVPVVITLNKPIPYGVVDIQVRLHRNSEAVKLAMTNIYHRDNNINFGLLTSEPDPTILKKQHEALNESVVSLLNNLSESFQEVLLKREYGF